MLSGLVRVLVPASVLVLSSTGGFEGHATRESHNRQSQARVVISGRITDTATTQPLAGAQVMIKDTQIGMLTAPDGKYRLSVPDSMAGRELTLLVRRIGYAMATRVIRPSSNAVTVDIALTVATMHLESVVVTGTAASVQRKSLGNAITRVDAASAAQTAGRNEPMEYERRRVHDRERGNTEGYDVINENPFIKVTSSPRSTFSIDVDHASYSNVRRFLRTGTRPPRDAVRLEELINYFPYELPAPRGDDPVSITTEVGVAPWNTTHRLVRVGLRGRPIDVDSLPPNNLVFLIDVSGSMQDDNKLPLLKSAFRLLVNELRPQDRVALVVYAGHAGLVLPSTSGEAKETILEAIDRLQAGGSTAGGAGIRLAYDVAKASFMPNGNNRVILATDGDFNVGTSSDAELVQLIEQRREQGTFLTVLGFGTGNVKDSKMEKLADKGNGNYAYVDNIMEARKVLVTEMGATLVTVAKDVKLQIEFNPKRVAAYRLLGYENRLLRDEDFTDDTKDAGELGAGHNVTALYEVIPPGAPDARDVRGSDPLRYTRDAATTARAGGSELMYVKLRYKPPTARGSREMTHVVRDEVTAAPSVDFQFASAVAEFGMVLRDSPHKGKSSMDSVVARAERTRGEDEYGYRAEFIRLATQARELVARENVTKR